MKLTLTKPQLKLLIRGLYLAAEWEDSCASVWQDGTPEWKRARRMATRYRKLRAKLFP